MVVEPITPEVAGPTSGLLTRVRRKVSLETPVPEMAVPAYLIAAAIDSLSAGPKRSTGTTMAMVAILPRSYR